MADVIHDGGRYRAAIWDPITNRSQYRNYPDRMVIHMAVTDSDDIYGPGKGPNDTYSHFYNPDSGRMRQHQEIHRLAYSELNGNGNSVGVEHDGVPGDHLSAAQIDADARLFAFMVVFWGVPNRIATFDNTHGLAWHRLGCAGNFGKFDPYDMTTWSTAQTGQRWSTSYGKTCPTNAFIRQIQGIWKLAQGYIEDYRRGGAPAPDPGKDWLDMATPNEVAEAVWGFKNPAVNLGDIDTYAHQRGTYLNASKALAAAESAAASAKKAADAAAQAVHQTSAIQREGELVSLKQEVANANTQATLAVGLIKAVADAVKSIPGVDATALATEVARQVSEITVERVADAAEDIAVQGVIDRLAE